MLYNTISIKWLFSGEVSPILQRIDINIVNLEECKRAYENQPNVLINHKQFCAGGTRERYACFGDSGGPFQVVNYVDDKIRYVQHGVVSFGPRFCGTVGIPGVYTRVAYFMNWILDNMKP